MEYVTKLTVVFADSYAQFRNWAREQGRNPHGADIMFCTSTMRDANKTRGLDPGFTEVVSILSRPAREWPDVLMSLRASGLHVDGAAALPEKK